MKVSLICPVYNEEESIYSLIESILLQTKKPDEIIFVDSLSKDNTAGIIKDYIKYTDKSIRLIERKTNIAQARNLAIKKSKNKIIACCDASCVLEYDWLEKITEPFNDINIDVVSGGYFAEGNTMIGKYIAMITVKPMDEWKEETFLPSSRSIAFRWSAWNDVGGYPVNDTENNEAGEDTLFDLKLKEKGYKFKLQKNAIVYWKPRGNIKDFAKQFYRYGKGDYKSGNLRRIKKNLIAFTLMNIYLLCLGFSFLFNPLITLILVCGLIGLFILQGVKYTIKKKKIGCLFVIPFLMFIKRFSFFFGIWGGLLE